MSECDVSGGVFSHLHTKQQLVQLLSLQTALPSHTDSADSQLYCRAHNGHPTCLCCQVHAVFELFIFRFIISQL